MSFHGVLDVIPHALLGLIRVAAFDGVLNGLVLLQRDLHIPISRRHQTPKPLAVPHNLGKQLGQHAISARFSDTYVKFRIKFSEPPHRVFPAHKPAQIAELGLNLLGSLDGRKPSDFELRSWPRLARAISEFETSLGRFRARHRLPRSFGMPPFAKTPRS